MATRSMVPRADAEGGIGTALKRWATGFINALTVSSIKIETGAGLNKILVSDADGDASWETANWSLVPTSNYTTAPASTSTITMGADMTSLISIGVGLKYTIGGVVYYGRVGAIANNLLTVNGAPLGGAVTNLYYGGTVRQVLIIIPSTYEDADNHDLIYTDVKSQVVWTLPVSYCVQFRLYSNTVDSGTKGKASIEINNADVCSSADGLTLTAANTWYSTVVDINTSNYDINPGEVLEITAHKGGTGDAADLTCIMFFVTP